MVYGILLLLEKLGIVWKLKRKTKPAARSWLSWMQAYAADREGDSKDLR
jgi:hypothetical protein